MFNVVPQWNPLRLAEDFATLHNLSGGRAILGVGRGTVPREVLHLNDKGVSIGSQDNPDQAADDAFNREVFEESMEIVRRALTEESFSFQGKHFQIPLPGIPDRGSTVQELTLVPRPLYPFEIWQAVTSPPTLDYVPVVDHGAVFWNQHYSFIKRFWDTYAENYAAAHDGHELADHEKRMLVVVDAHRGHDGAGRGPRRSPATTSSGSSSARTAGAAGYMGPDGKPAAPGLIPTLDESIENKTLLVGTPEHVAAGGAVPAVTCSASSTSRSSRTCSATRTRRPTSRWPVSPRRSCRSCRESRRPVDRVGRRSAAGRRADQGPRVGGAGEHPVGLDHDGVGVTEARVPRRRRRDVRWPRSARSRRPRRRGRDLRRTRRSGPAPSRCRTRWPDRGAPSGRR